MTAICRKVENLGFHILCPRNFNQDSLENLFYCIRQRGIANTNPTCHQFIAALKTCVVNNVSLPASSKSNCQKDGDSLLVRQSAKFNYKQI